MFDVVITTLLHRYRRQDRSIAVWDIVSPKEINLRRVLLGHRAAVNVVDFDLNYIVSASGDRTIKVGDDDGGFYDDDGGCYDDDDDGFYDDGGYDDDITRSLMTRDDLKLLISSYIDFIVWEHKID